MGRAMLGIGPGQLPSDAFMMGIDPRDQRDMMIEAIEVILPLLRGEVVSKQTDWFTLDEARLQLRPFSPRRHRGRSRVDVLAHRRGARRPARPRRSCRSRRTTPSASTRSTRTGTTTSRPPSQHGMPAERDRWRAVASMHLAETREQAEREIEHGVLTLCGYFEGMSNRKLPWAGSPREAVTHWIEQRLPELRHRHGRHARRRARDDRQAEREVRWLRDVPVPRAQLRRLGGDEALVRAVRRARHPGVP